MNAASSKRALAVAVTAARAAGKMMREHFRSPKKITLATQYDIKLELDLLCQKRIERTLRRAFPKIALLGEEGMAGDPKAEQRWVVDPIDGTVNFTYGIPHACVSIALQVDEAIVSLGFAKQPATLKRMLPVFNDLIHRVRKIRMMGAAALAMVYVASGRLDAYTEYGVCLWDIAAGGLILECAGGEFWRRPVAGDEAYYVIANNGRLRRQLEKIG